MLTTSIHKASTNPIKPLLDLIDVFVELFLSHVISPFLVFHERVDRAVNCTLRQVLDSYPIPTWVTANFISYARTALVIPTLILLAWKHTLLPAILVIAVDCGDFLDGVVTRHWLDAIQKKTEKKNDVTDPDSFEVISTGSPKALPSWVQLQREKAYGGFIDAVLDKAYIIPCWISLLHVVSTTHYLHLVQYVTFICLILAETASGSILFKAYYTAGGMPAPVVHGFDFSSSAVTANHVDKAKQTFEMVGTALYMLPYTRYMGLFLLCLAVPLAYESVRRKTTKRVIYVPFSSSSSDTASSSWLFDHTTLKFWMQARALGSKLVVGIPGDENKSNSNNCTASHVMNARAVSSVDEVIVQAPDKADLLFLDQYEIDYCLVPHKMNLKSSRGSSKSVTEEVMNCRRCLQMGEDGIVRLVTSSQGAKEE